jgi:hypothetical protein
MNSRRFITCSIALGCSVSGMDSVIISEDFSSPTLIAKLPGESGTDENWFNPGDNHYFFGNSTPQKLGIVDALGENGSGSPVEDASAASSDGSHSVAADPVGNQVYVPINNAAGAASKICSSHTDANGNPGVDANGCIAVYTVEGGTGPNDPGSCRQQRGSLANCPPKGNKN